jgi:hypothetical protein
MFERKRLCKMLYGKVWTHFKHIIAVAQAVNQVYIEFLIGGITLYLQT